MWFLVLSRTIRSAEERRERMQPHLDWLTEQHLAGRALFSGQTRDDEYGVYVLLADSLEEARAMAQQDPYHIHGDRQMQVLDWTPKRAMRLNVSVADIEAMARQER